MSRGRRAGSVETEKWKAKGRNAGRKRGRQKNEAYLLD